jgi:hypothetical protein
MLPGAAVTTVTTTAVFDRALVVHLYAPAHQGESRQRLRTVLQACSDRLGMTQPIAGVGPYELPELVTGARDSAVAAREAPGEGIFQAVVRQVHDVLALSLVVSPSPADVGWRELEGRWVAVAPDGDAWALGEARLLTAVARSPARLSGTFDGVEGPFAPPFDVDGHTVVWEQEGTDPRSLRRFVAVARAGREDESDAWLWSRGDEGLPPFGAYLLHTAKVRHQLRTREAAEATVSTALDRADALLRERYDRGGADAADHLVAMRGQLSRLLAGPSGLTRLATSLREMGRTVRIAASNTRLVAPPGTTGNDIEPGIVADDLALADWVAQHIDDDLVYVEAARERVRDGLTEVVQAAEEAIQDRREALAQRQERSRRERERFDLLQTGLIGAVLMVLAATQSFGYRVPLAGSIVPAVIAFLGSLVLVLAAAAVTLRTTADESRGAEVVASTTAGLASAALSWVGVAAVVQLVTGEAAPALLTIGVALPAFAAGAILTSRWWR